MLHSSALYDSFTGTIPATGSNLWGWGKINAFAGLPATTVPMYKLEVATENYRQGYVTGHGRHPQGQHVIEAFSLEGYAFRQWSDGNRDNPRVVDLVSDTVFVAYFEQNEQGVVTVEQQGFTVSTSGLCFTIAGAPEGRLSVYDIMGRRVLFSPVANGTVSLLVAGVYLVSVGDIPTRKIVAIR